MTGSAISRRTHQGLRVVKKRAALRAPHTCQPPSHDCVVRTARARTQPTHIESRRCDDLNKDCCCEPHCRRAHDAILGVRAGCDIARRARPARVRTDPPLPPSLALVRPANTARIVARLGRMGCRSVRGHGRPAHATQKAAAVSRRRSTGTQRAAPRAPSVRPRASLPGRAVICGHLTSMPPIRHVGLVTPLACGVWRPERLMPLEVRDECRARRVGDLARAPWQARIARRKRPQRRGQQHEELAGAANPARRQRLQARVAGPRSAGTQRARPRSRARVHTAPRARTHLTHRPTRTHRAPARPSAAARAPSRALCRHASPRDSFDGFSTVYALFAGI